MAARTKAECAYLRATSLTSKTTCKHRRFPSAPPQSCPSNMTMWILLPFGIVDFRVRQPEAAGLRVPVNPIFIGFPEFLPPGLEVRPGS